MAAAAVPGFAAVALAPAAPFPDEAAPPTFGLIELELPAGGRVRISGVPDPATVTAALRVLVGR